MAAAWHLLALTLVLLVLAVGNVVAAATEDTSCAVSTAAFASNAFALLLITYGAFSLALSFALGFVALAVGCDADEQGLSDCAALWLRIAGFFNLVLLFLFGAATYAFATTVAGACAASSPWFTYGIFFLVSQALVGAYGWLTAPLSWWANVPPLPCCGAAAPSISIRA
jgi:hypothetical protein